MDKPISVGDLVQVVRPPTCPEAPVDSGLGHTFVVEGIRDHTAGMCAYCNDLHTHGPALFAADGNGLWPLRRLKRIPPLGELEGEKRDEEITA